MTKRRRISQDSGTDLLAHVRGTGKILDPWPKPKATPICCCPPAEPNQLGGCRPALRLEAGVLTPRCATCLKLLQRGAHRRRQQIWALGLAEQHAHRPGQVDLADLEAGGFLLEPLP